MGNPVFPVCVQCARRMKASRQEIRNSEPMQIPRSPLGSGGKRSRRKSAHKAAAASDKKLELTTRQSGLVWYLAETSSDGRADCLIMPSSASHVSPDARLQRMHAQKLDVDRCGLSPSSRT